MMINILNADFYRFFKTKSVRILFILEIVLMLFSSLSTGLVLGNASWMQNYYMRLLNTSTINSEISEALMNMIFEMKALIKSGEDFITVCLCTETFYFNLLFVVLFFGSLKKSGVIYNILPNVSYRKLVISNLLMCLLFNAILVFIEFVFGNVMYYIFFEGYSFGNVCLLIEKAVSVVLLGTAFASLTMTVSDLFKKRWAGPLAVLIYLFFVYGFIKEISEKIFVNALGTGFTTEYISVVGSYSFVFTAGQTDILRFVLLSAFYIAVSILLEEFVVRKRDFR